MIDMMSGVIGMNLFEPTVYDHSLDDNGPTSPVLSPRMPHRALPISTLEEHLEIDELDLDASLLTNKLDTEVPKDNLHANATRDLDDIEFGISHFPLERWHRQSTNQFNLLSGKNRSPSTVFFNRSDYKFFHRHFGRGGTYFHASSTSKLLLEWYFPRALPCALCAKTWW